MNALDISGLVEDLIKDFEKSETHSILFYSQDKDRDFRLLIKRVKEYRERLNKLLTDGEFDVRSAGVSAGAGDIQE